MTATTGALATVSAVAAEGVSEPTAALPEIDTGAGESTGSPEGAIKKRIAKNALVPAKRITSAELRKKAVLERRNHGPSFGDEAALAR